MALKLIINSLDDVAENLRGLYEKEGDNFVLQTDDDGFKRKISEFRNSNIDLVRQVESLTEAEKELKDLQEKMSIYKDIDPEAARDAMQKMEAIEEKNLIDKGQIDSVVEQRVERRIERMKADWEGKNAALQKALDQAQGNENSYRSKLEEVVIDSSLQNAIMSVGSPRKGAIQDLIARGKGIWKLDDSGNPIPMNGDEVLYGKDGKQPISPEEWAQSQLLEAPYLFEGNAGGGAGGNLNGSLEHGQVSLGDQDALNNNIEAIAKGEVVVGGGS